MTNANTQRLTTVPRFVPGTSRGPRSTVTFSRQMAAAMEAERRAEMAQRIRELRGPVPQPVMADRIGIGLRGYQEWEGGRSAPTWENLKELARVHGVTEDYILYGDASERETDEPVVTSSAELAAIRADLAGIREDMAQITDLMRQLLDPLHGLVQAQALIDPKADAPASKPVSPKAKRGARRATA